MGLMEWLEVSVRRARGKVKGERMVEGGPDRAIRAHQLGQIRLSL